MPKSKVDVRARQAPIRERYREDPDSAPQVLRVRGGSGDLTDPPHCVVSPESVPTPSFAPGRIPPSAATATSLVPRTCCSPR